MSRRSSIQQIFDSGWSGYCTAYHPSDVQKKAAWSMMHCHTPSTGFNSMSCPDCGHIEIHYNSCRNRNCPNCQAILKELWIDARRSEVIDSPYFHLVFTVPARLHPLLLANQKLLYSLLHRCAADTVLSLAADRKFLGAEVGIVQILHTWGQRLNYHPHIHAIVSGGGLTRDQKLKCTSQRFFLPLPVMSKVFRGKFLASLQDYYHSDHLSFPASLEHLCHPAEWGAFRNALYQTDWNLFIKETFNGNGNAIEYLGRYANRIAITNSRILSVSDNEVRFSAFDYKSASKVTVSLSCQEFIRRFMLHILPAGFQKIRYYGFLKNRCKRKNLTLIFRLQGHQRFLQKFTGMSTGELLKAAWGYDLQVCKVCGCRNMQHAGRGYPLRC